MSAIRRKVSVSIGRIVVIESLREGERRTGLHLYQDRIVPLSEANGLAAPAFWNVRDKRELFDALRYIFNEKEPSSGGLVLHLEMHGHCNGVQLASGEVVSWPELQPYLQAINIMFKCQLVVALAVCEGVHIGQLLTHITDRAPFTALIGPKSKVSAGTLESGFIAFYEHLFESRDIRAALSVLNAASKPVERFEFISAEALFLQSTAIYLRELCSSKAIEQRMRGILARSDSSVSARLPIAQRRQLVKRMLRDSQAAHIYDSYRSYLSLDLAPGNGILTQEDFTDLEKQLNTRLKRTR